MTRWQLPSSVQWLLTMISRIVYLQSLSYGLLLGVLGADSTVLGGPRPAQGAAKQLKEDLLRHQVKTCIDTCHPAEDLSRCKHCFSEHEPWHWWPYPKGKLSSQQIRGQALAATGHFCGLESSPRALKFCKLKQYRAGWSLPLLSIFHLVLKVIPSMNHVEGWYWTSFTLSLIFYTQSHTRK